VTEGARVWLIPDGYLPARSSGEQVSHEAICFLNTGADEAHVSMSFYFEDRDPINDVRVVVGAERTLHLRTDVPAGLGGAEIPHGVPYAVRVESDVPICVQHSRMDTSQEALTLMTTMAYPVG